MDIFEGITFPQFFTYVVTPVLAGITGLLGLIRYLAPRWFDAWLKKDEKITDAGLEEKRDSREYVQQLNLAAFEAHQTDRALERSSANAFVENLGEMVQDAYSWTRENVEKKLDDLSKNQKELCEAVSAQNVPEFVQSNVVKMLQELIEEQKKLSAATVRQAVELQKLDGRVTILSTHVAQHNDKLDRQQQND